MTTEGELWHIVEAKRDDGTPTMFRIRELEPQRQLTKIFVVELPYPKTDLTRLPNVSDYRRLTEFDEQWLRPACSALGWEYVGWKTEDGSFFFYTYGCADPNAMIEKLSPFDVALGFYDDDDPDWQEYGTLKELLDQAKAFPATPPAPDLAALPHNGTPSQPPTVAPAPAATKATSSAKAKPTKRKAAKATKATKATKAKKAKKTKAKPKAKAKASARPQARGGKATKAKPKSAKQKRR